MDERKNVFERAQPRTTLAEDQKTRFTKHDENRAARLKAADTLQERIDRRENQRKVWRSGGRTGTARSTSVLLDAKTQTLRDEMEAEKRQSKAPPVAAQAPPSAMTIAAIILEWERQNPLYFRSIFNAEAMKNFLLENIATGKLCWGYEAMDVAFQWLRENNFLESAPRPRKRGDFSSTPAPRIYPPFESQAESDARLTRQQIEYAREIEREVERAFSLPFAALQKTVRSSLPRYGTEAVR